MNSADRQLIIERYRQRLGQFGKDVRALASGTVERQRVRFEVLAGVGSLEGASILDLGCGFADFYDYLRQRGVSVDYTGYDISPDLIDLAKGRFPEARFEIRDIQESGFAGAYDYIVCSQTFNNLLRNENNLSLVKDVLARCYAACRKGMAFDMLTTYVDYREDHLFYYEPETIFRFCKSLTKRVTLRHDYPLFEFTVFLYPDFPGWSGDRAPHAFNG
jgi:SAM-dependent methyltransferase